MRLGRKRIIVSRARLGWLLRQEQMLHYFLQHHDFANLPEWDRRPPKSAKPFVYDEEPF